MLPLLMLAATVSCPSLTTPTARGALGDLQVQVTHTEQGYVCQFTGAEVELDLEVTSRLASSQFTRFAEAACRNSHDAAPLKGIGNEAMACTVDASERIVGRVRNQAFVLRLNKPSHGKLKDLAETVAGNLF
jgi:hypothetical protein